MAKAIASHKLPLFFSFRSNGYALNPSRLSCEQEGDLDPKINRKVAAPPSLIRSVSSIFWKPHVT